MAKREAKSVKREAREITLYAVGFTLCAPKATARSFWWN
jgi:hypothetical protein